MVSASVRGVHVNTASCISCPTVNVLGSDGEVLVVYAPFEPVPLEGVLGEQGFDYVADQLESGDWRVTFRRG